MDVEAETDVPMDAAPSRRDMLKKTVVAGGLIWAAPTILSAPAGAQTSSNCRDCENNGVLYRVKISSATSANCGDACIDIRGVYGSGPGQPRCGSCLFDVGALARTEVFVNGQYRGAEVTIDPRLRLIEAGVQYKGECYTVDCTDGFAYVQEDGAPNIVVTPGSIPVPPSDPGTRTTVLFETGTENQPINHTDFVVCYAAGGTDFPGC